MLIMNVPTLIVFNESVKRVFSNEVVPYIHLHLLKQRIIIMLVYFDQSLVIVLA